MKALIFVYFFCLTNRAYSQVIGLGDCFSCCEDIVLLFGVLDNEVVTETNELRCESGCNLENPNLFVCEEGTELVGCVVGNEMRLTGKTTFIEEEEGTEVSRFCNSGVISITQTPTLSPTPPTKSPSFSPTISPTIPPPTVSTDALDSTIIIGGSIVGFCILSVFIIVLLVVNRKKSSQNENKSLSNLKTRVEEKEKIVIKDKRIEYDPLPMGGGSTIVPPSELSSELAGFKRVKESQLSQVSNNKTQLTQQEDDMF